MLRILFCVFASLWLAGCASQGPAQMIPLTLEGQQMVLVAHEQNMPDWLLKRDSLKLNYLVIGEQGDRQRNAVSAVEIACRRYTDTIRPSNTVLALTSGIVNGLFGAVSLGIGSQAFAGTSASEYAQYGGAASFGAGMASGVMQLGGQTYTFENCAREVLGTAPGIGVRVLHKSPY